MPTDIRTRRPFSFRITTSPYAPTPPGSPAGRGMGRRRLAGYNEHRGTKTGFSVLGAFLFGGAFVAAGVAIVLVGMHVIQVDPGSVHAPYWVLVVCGGCFAGGGLAVWGMASTQRKEEMRRREAVRRFGGSEALTDHAWDPRGYTPPHWARALQGVVGAGFMTLFLSVFNWWAWGAHGPVVVKIVVVLFDLILVLIWQKAVLGVGRAIKFGDSRVEFDHFPLSVKGPIAIQWVPPRGIARADRGSVTFRCIEEYYEERGSGKDRSRWLVHDELCAETQSFDKAQTFVPGRRVEFRFEPPEGAQPTHLSADRPVYWEFEVVLSMPGPDFVERYLIPVY
jgi:hypothetical protein